VTVASFQLPASSFQRAAPVSSVRAGSGKLVTGSYRIIASYI
jgi:hypothetical protein